MPGAIGEWGSVLLRKLRRHTAGEPQPELLHRHGIVRIPAVATDLQTYSCPSAGKLKNDFLLHVSADTQATIIL